MTMRRKDGVSGVRPFFCVWREKEQRMVDQFPSARKGIAKTLTLSQEAVDALLVLTPSKNNQGRVVSQLLVAEVLRREVRREERQQIKDGVLKLLEDRETVCP
jgi:hypothetical protein